LAYPQLNFIGTDFSQNALEIFAQHPNFDLNRTRLLCWDVLNPFPHPSSMSVDAVLLIFALSAIHPADHSIALQNISNVLCSGSYVLFRDYGVYDMTMFRHTKRLGENLYERSDGTLSYYFDIQYLENLASSCGFQVVEIKYATVLNRNRKSGIEMRRVFLHAVLQKS
jgi:SAM-dependent methyltransferase